MAASKPRRGEFGWRPAGAVPIPMFAPDKPSSATESFVIAIDLGTTRSAISVLIQKAGQPFSAVHPADTFCPAQAVDAKVETILLFSSPSALGTPSSPVMLSSEVLTNQGADWVAIGPASLCKLETEKTGYYVRDFKMELDIQSKRAKGLPTKLHEMEVKAVSLQGDKPPISVKLFLVLTAFVACAAKIGWESLLALAKTIKECKVPTQNEISWVLTIPAIWVDQARIFMREVALAVGMSSDLFTKNIGICLEPEGAMLEMVRDSRLRPISQLKTRSVLILDWGGGTADITFSRVDSISEDFVQFEERSRPLGGPYGGRQVNEEIDRLIFRPLFGETIFNDLWINEGFRDRYFRNSIEEMKCATRLHPPSPWTIHLHHLFDLDPRVSMPVLIEGIKALNATLPMDSKVSQGSLRGRPFITIPHTLVFACFNKCIDPVLSLISPILSDPDPPAFIFIVGGMGSNSYLIEYVQSKTPNFRVIDSTNASNAIVLGATRFGLDPGAFGYRKARTNYGLKLYGEKWGPLIPKDMLLRDVSKIKLPTYSPVTSEQKKIRVTILESDLPMEKSSLLTPTCYPVTEMTIPCNMSVPFSDRKYQIQLSMDQAVISGLVMDVSNQTTTLMKWGSR